MSKIWGYIAAFFGGIASAFILIFYTDKPDTVQHINKVKQKGGPGNTMDTSVEFTPVDKPKKEKRIKRKLNKQLKKVKL